MIIEKNKKLSTGEVARLCSATTASVNNWIKSNKIRAYNTPGGQYRILIEDLIQFIIENNMPIPEELKELIKRKILIIDDDNSNINILRDTIEKISDHIEISVSNDGYEALIKAGNIKPDIIFLNSIMSHIDTNRMYENLRSSEILKRTIIIIIEHNNYQKSKSILITKPDEKIEKPLVINKIKTLLQKTLNL